MNDELRTAENTAVENYTAQIESILFVASGPVSTHRIATALEITQGAVNGLLAEMGTDYQRRGLRLQWSGTAVQLTTAPENSAIVERFLGLELTTRLSQAALEVLSIVAFLQPVTRPQVDQIRGVNSDSSLRTLLSQGLIEELGRMETPGRPILYGTTPEFLQHFGLSSIDDLPPIDLEDTSSDGQFDEALLQEALNEIALMEAFEEEE